MHVHVSEIFVDSSVFTTNVQRDTGDESNELSEAISINHLDSVNTMIINGQRATKGEYPWSVVITKRQHFHCGGILLNSWTVITAAQRVPSNK